MAAPSALTSGVTSPCATASATVTGCVTSSQIVAPASATAITPTTPTRLRLRRAADIKETVHKSTPGMFCSGLRVLDGRVDQPVPGGAAACRHLAAIYR